ncbi:J domain-containing protein [Haliea atlantica]
MAELLLIYLAYVMSVFLARGIYELIRDYGPELIIFLARWAVRGASVLMRSLIALLGWLTRLVRIHRSIPAARMKDSTDKHSREEETKGQDHEEVTSTENDIFVAARALLGVSATADAAEIKRAYRRAIRAAHPDMGGSVEAAQAVNIAYELITSQRACR